MEMITRFSPSVLQGEYPIYQYPGEKGLLSVCLGIAVVAGGFEWFVLSDVPESIFDTIDGVEIALPENDDELGVVYFGFVVNQQQAYCSEFGSFSAKELAQIGVMINHSSDELRDCLPPCDPEDWINVGVAVFEKGVLISAIRK